jgi:hypothetical protein
MKKQKPSKIASTKKSNTKTFLLFICSVILLTVSCKKSASTQSNTQNTQQLNTQEQTLVGKWSLKKNETYEITGIDSTGQYICSLIGGSDCDSTCNIIFKSEYSKPVYPELKGNGVIGGCDSTTAFIWKAKQAKQIEINSGSFYDIVYLTNDSVALSNVYTKDILKLKSIAYYKRN